MTAKFVGSVHDSILIDLEGTLLDVDFGVAGGDIIAGALVYEKGGILYGAGGCPRSTQEVSTRYVSTQTGRFKSRSNVQDIPRVPPLPKLEEGTPEFNARVLANRLEGLPLEEARECAIKCHNPREYLDTKRFIAQMKKIHDDMMEAMGKEVQHVNCRSVVFDSLGVAQYAAKDAEVTLDLSRLK